MPAAAFVSPSRFLADRMIAWGLPADRFAVIENGLRRVEAPVPPRRTRGKPWVFGYFGQLTPFKGGDILLDAIENLGQSAEHGIRLRLHGTLVGQPPEFVNRFEAAFASQEWGALPGALRQCRRRRADERMRLRAHAEHLVGKLAGRHSGGVRRRTPCDLHRDRRYGRESARQAGGASFSSRRCGRSGPGDARGGRRCALRRALLAIAGGDGWGCDWRAPTWRCSSGWGVGSSSFLKKRTKKLLRT